ncbi:MAG: hypothetical protein JSW58_06260 [Candidatus Latescibacterota bacterium]|nr:MAG: hypothetical protein JSW58_06260 [Candidatus Latescibacterota bacterium]
MESLDLIYVKPFPIPLGSPFDFRISNASGPLAKLVSIEKPPSHPDSESFVSDALVQALTTDPVRILATSAQRVLIDGHRRMSEAVSRDLEAIPAVVYPRSTSRETVIQLSLKGKATVLSGVEKIIALYKTTVFANDDTPRIDIPCERPVALEPPDCILPAYSDLFGRNVSKTYLLGLFEVLSFPAEDLHSIHDLSLTVEQTASLLDLTSPERRAALHLGKEARFTASEFGQLARLLLLARSRSGFDLDAWVNRECQSDRERRGGSQIVGSLAREIHPELHAAVERVDRKIRQMRLPNRLRIVAPENLEGGSFSCYFKFSTLEELRNHVEKLEETIDTGSAEQILKLLAFEDLGRRTERDESH